MGVRGKREKNHGEGQQCGDCQDGGRGQREVKEGMGGIHGDGGNTW